MQSKLFLVQMQCYCLPAHGEGFQRPLSSSRKRNFGITDDLSNLQMIQKSCFLLRINYHPSKSGLLPPLPRRGTRKPSSSKHQGLQVEVAKFQSFFFFGGVANFRTVATKKSWKKVGNFCFCSVNSKQIAKILQKSQNLSKPQQC